MKITDGMVEAFGAAWQEAHEFEEALNNDRWFVPAGYKRKCGLAAVLPLIEAALRKEIARDLKAVDPVEWALAGEHAGDDAARIVRKDAS